MRKVAIISLIISLLILKGGSTLKQQNVQSSLSTSVVEATRYLEVRPNSNKNNSDLTYSQLMSFYTTITDIAQHSITNLYDVDATYINDRLALIDSFLETLSESQFESDKATYYNVYEMMFELYSYTLESRSVEGRGIWHRPFETNLDDVRRTLQSLQNMGINMLYVETFWLGRLIYDSQIPNTFQHGFTLGGYSDESVDYGTNLLEAFIEEGKAYGIEVHAWVENFFVGYGTSYTNSPILKQNPDWASYNYDGTIPQKSEVNYLFMDPANPETREYLKAIYSEIAAGYDVASIHLDYIRYPVARNTTSAPSSNLDTGYSAYAEREFKYLYGYTDDLRELVVSNQDVALDWAEYKKNVISDFVAGVYYAVKNQDPNVYLSTAIFGNITSAIETKMQDWARWVEDGYVEMILPMAYYQNSVTVRSEVDRLVGIVDNNSFSYAGIAPSYMGYNDHLNSTQIAGSIEANAQGVTFFATQNYLVYNVDGVHTFNTKVQDILQDGAFRNDAIVPHENTDLVIETILNNSLRKANDLYLVAEKMTASNYSDLNQVYTTIKSLPAVSDSDLQAVIDALEAIDVTMYASSPATTRIQDDITYLIQILQITKQRLNFDQTIDITVNPDKDPTLPEVEELSPPANIVLDGDKLIWDDVEGATQYQVTINNTDFYTDTNRFDLSEAFYITGNNIMSVKAIGDDVYYTDSVYGETVTLVSEELSIPTNIQIIDNVITFDPVEGATQYQVKFGFYSFFTTDPTLDITTLDLTSRTYDVEVRALGDSIYYLTSPYATEFTYGYDQASIEALFEPLFKRYINRQTQTD